MIDRNPEPEEVEPAGEKLRWIQRAFLAAVGALVIGLYAYTAHSAYWVSKSLNPADDYYNLLVQGFRTGHLSLKKEVPPELAQLANPYDQSINRHYGVTDLSYYKGKLYLYFGVTPAVVLGWPYVALTGHYLLQKDAVLIFCVIGFLAGAGLLVALWRRYFGGSSVAVVAAGVLAFGLVTGTPLLLARSDVYEVPVSCGYAFTMLALAAIWQACHQQRQRGWWLAAASLAYGLAVGARPALLFGAIILLGPVVQAWRERRRIGPLMIAATGPLLLIGLGLMLYNAGRFDNPFEFGFRYQMDEYRPQLEQQHYFSARYLWFNFRLYFLGPAGWSGRFPFVRDSAVPSLPAGYQGVEQVFGVLANIPLIWLVLAVPLAWRRRTPAARSLLREFLVIVTLLFGVVALTLCLYHFAASRYEVEFLPALVLLAVVGIFGLERTRITPGAWLAERPVWRRAVSGGWILLLGCSVAFNLLASVGRCAESNYHLGVVLEQAGRHQEAIGRLEEAVWLKPDYAAAHYNLGIVLERAGRAPEAIEQFEQALRLTPGDAGAHNNLGVVLGQVGRVPEAIEQFKQALGLTPGDAETHNNLGVVLGQAGRTSEAIEQFEQALRLMPDYPDAHNNLGVVLEQTGRRQAAIEQFQEAVRLKPDFREAQNSLARLRKTP